jgi:hypothetical protein
VGEIGRGAAGDWANLLSVFNEVEQTGGKVFSGSGLERLLIGLIFSSFAT